MSFGNDLRAERERRGITLEQVSDGTKVSVRHLKALEAGEHAQLPGGIFNKGFVRAYCRYLALDEEEWVGRFSEFAHTDGPEDWAEFAENVKRNRIRSQHSTGRRWLGVLLLLALLAAAGWAAWHYVVKPRLHEPVLQRFHLGRSGR